MGGRYLSRAQNLHYNFTMLSRRTFHVLLTFLLLFGQAASLAHTLEHLSNPKSVQPCQVTHKAHGSHTHPMPVHSFHEAAQHTHQTQNSDPGVYPASSRQPEFSEHEFCLIYHLHGSLQAGIVAQTIAADFYAHQHTVGLDESDSVHLVLITLYDSRAPPADA